MSQASRIKEGQKIESFISIALHKKFKVKVRKNSTSMGQVIRELVDKYVRG